MFSYHHGRQSFQRPTLRPALARLRLGALSTESEGATLVSESNQAAVIAQLRLVFERHRAFRPCMEHATWGCPCCACVGCFFILGCWPDSIHVCRRLLLTVWNRWSMALDLDGMRRQRWPLLNGAGGSGATQSPVTLVPKRHSPACPDRPCWGSSSACRLAIW